MKVGIITFHHTTNYGATLQTYALWETIKKQGHEVEVIDYRPHSAVRHYQKKIFNPVKTHGKKHFLINFKKYFLPSLKKYLRMRNFLTSKLKLSKKILNRKELSRFFENEGEYDIVVTGSDQVWCTISIRGFDPSYFLDFIPQASKCKKVSYAASFGSTKALEGEHETITHLIKRFDSISVRDSNSINIVQNKCGAHAVKVLDPTFLTDFKAVIPDRENKEEPYLLLYFEKTMSSKEKALIKTIAKRRDLKIISIGDPYDFSDKILMGAGPDEWLFYFKNASFIVTSFYHGTIFSIKFRKQFITLARESKKNKTQDLLSLIGLDHRLITEIDPDTANKQLREIDYGLVNHYIESEVEKSNSYLVNSLSPTNEMSLVK